MRKPVTLLLALLGLFDSLYLLWIYTSPTRTLVCVGTGCDTVRLSSYAHLWGIPMPALGVAGYVVIALVVVAESLAGSESAANLRYALAGLTSFGLLYSLYLEYLQGFVIHAFCAWCITSGVIMAVLCVLSILNLMRPSISSDAILRLAEVRAYFGILILWLVIGIPAFYELAIHGEQPPPPPPTISESTEAQLVRPDSHVSGNPNSAVTVVEFGDFECPVCGREEPVAKEIRAKYADRIRFVFRQFPLIHTHPFAQRMAEASECVADQGKFWEMVDTIYAHQEDLSEDALNKDASMVGVDMGKFRQCMDSHATLSRVTRDHDDGKALGVNATPTFFVGRRPVDGVPDAEELSRLIDQQLGGHGANAETNPPVTHNQKPESVTPREHTGTPASGTAPAPSPETPAGSGFGLLGSAPGSAFGSFQTGVACSEEEAAKKQPELIHTDQVKALMSHSPSPLFVDVRSAKEFAAGNVPGSINIPIDDMPKRWNTLPKDRVIVFYESGKSAGDICASGRAAGRILLENKFPYDHVKVYQDGLAGWQKAGLSVPE